MKILFVADGRSPIALNWIRYFADRGQEVHLVSTFPCQPDVVLGSKTVIPLPFMGGGGGSGNGGLLGELSRWTTPSFRTALRHWLVPWGLPRGAAQLQSVIGQLRPDLVHAMRIPYEGMLAALAMTREPERTDSDPLLLVSVWGNDFTLHAPSNQLMKRYTHLCLQQVDALHTDCKRDQRLAGVWGFDMEKHNIVLPGAGGVQRDMFHPPLLSTLSNLPNNLMVINPRGMRAYIRNEAFFQSIPRVLENEPMTQFLCPAMADESQAENWLVEFDIAHAVELMPPQSRAQMADLFRRAQVTVSPSLHDGTPNTLLEAMACGCFPVVGDLESIREWITPGVNGLLVDPNDPRALAEAILLGLRSSALRARAREYNTRLINTEAEYERVMGEAERFYESLI